MVAITSAQSTSSATSTSNSTSSSSSSVSTSSYDSFSASSTGQMMAAEGKHPPDFDSMSTDEFRDHLVELQEQMAADGIDISGFTDPTTLSDDELNALKDEMSAMGSRGPQGKQGPPPPPSSDSVEEEEDNTLQILINALATGEDDEETDESTLAEILTTLV